MVILLGHTDKKEFLKCNQELLVWGSILKIPSTVDSQFSDILNLIWENQQIQPYSSTTFELMRESYHMGRQRLDFPSFFSLIWFLNSKKVSIRKNCNNRAYIQFTHVFNGMKNMLYFI
jgi:hypothetical protein